MQLEEFFDYKNRLMEDLLTSKPIVLLLSDDQKVIEKPETLIYEQVFPYEHIPDTTVRGNTFICAEVEIQKASSKTFLTPTLYIWVFTHKSKMRLPEGGVRVDKLCSEIAKTINGSRHYGLGELDLYSVKRFAPMEDYQGKVMTFQATDFNRFTPTGKPIPSNRKLGR